MCGCCITLLIKVSLLESCLVLVCSLLGVDREMQSRNCCREIVDRERSSLAASRAGQLLGLGLGIRVLGWSAPRLGLLGSSSSGPEAGWKHQLLSDARATLKIFCQILPLYRLKDPADLLKNHHQVPVDLVYFASKRSLSAPIIEVT